MRCIMAADLCQILGVHQAIMHATVNLVQNSLPRWNGVDLVRIHHRSAGYQSQSELPASMSKQHMLLQDEKLVSKMFHSDSLQSKSNQLAHHQCAQIGPWLRRQPWRLPWAAGRHWGRTAWQRLTGSRWSTCRHHTTTRLLETSPNKSL